MSIDIVLSSEASEWSTPEDFFRTLHREFSFTLDVCASEINAKCKRYFSEADDGLKQQWESTSWMNPPCGQRIRPWLAKAYSEAQRGVRVVGLVPARMDTRWQFDLVLRADEIRFYKDPLEFIAIDGTEEYAPFPSALVVYGGRRGDGGLPHVRWFDRNGAVAGSPNGMGENELASIPAGQHGRLDGLREARPTRERAP